MLASKTVWRLSSGLTYSEMEKGRVVAVGFNVLAGRSWLRVSQWHWHVVACGV